MKISSSVQNHQKTNITYLLHKTNYRFKYVILDSTEALFGFLVKSRKDYSVVRSWVPSSWSNFMIGIVFRCLIGLLLLHCVMHIIQEKKLIQLIQYIWSLCRVRHLRQSACNVDCYKGVIVGWIEAACCLAKNNISSYWPSKSFRRDILSEDYFRH